MTSKRDYGQFCGLASGLDIVGERWTLLIVRQLLIGPARFNELLHDLPGLAPNLLSERLRSMTANGLISASATPGDARGKVYELTEDGLGLREPVLALARWGLGQLGKKEVGGTVRAGWGFLAIQAMTIPELIPQVSEQYEFRIDDEVFGVRVGRGQTEFVRGPLSPPDLTIHSSAETFIRVGTKALTPFEALATGEMRVEGSVEAVQRCSRMLGLT
ncbi:DNA-binding HxlR family transcriptional regulator [Nocardiopsis arvandica]|uniref:DNA-binding HxlR family transcriptional regulator n=1 Tax=Nocardiopsis sinuspersici TaxID=501010 RepID=A0A7Y9X9B7_9ACTN|nr:winged helix-turn-helix transcriptional regulator [Nocardiopsis sinuspersici]NYH50590.1 DNA-binding HxlR family transcriptional regulator [Nocardiopsis sinuspersici]